MKICIYGAGAVGGMIGGELARVGHQVTLIGRGPHLAAIKANGLTVLMEGETRRTSPACTQDPAEAGRQELVIMVLKAHHVAAAAANIAPLLGPDTPVIAAQNGIPWWYFHAIGGDLEGHVLQAIDAGRSAWNLIGPERVVGAVINGPCRVVEPGIIEHNQKSRSLTVGEPDRSHSPRCAMIADAFAATDIDTPISDDIRLTIWAKLLSNAVFGQLCVMTRSNHGDVNGDPGCIALARRLMLEIAEVCRPIGVDLDSAVRTRINARPSGGAHKPSTLQDLELGRPMEIDAMVGAIAEIGRMVDVPTPYLDSLYALLRRLAETTGTYPDNPAFSLDYD